MYGIKELKKRSLARPFMKSVVARMLGSNSVEMRLDPGAVGNQKLALLQQECTDDEDEAVVVMGAKLEDVPAIHAGFSLLHNEGELNDVADYFGVGNPLAFTSRQEYKDAIKDLWSSVESG